MGRSSWQDYDRAAMSAGGGIYARGAKSIVLSPEARERLGAPEGELLHMEKVHVTPGTNEVTLVVDKKPVKAGFDPFNKMVDRDPDDNMVSVEPAGG